MPLPPDDAPRVLIADDQSDVLDALRLLLHPEGIVTEAVQSPSAVIDALGRRDFDVLLMDLNYARDTTSGREGLDLLARVHAIDPTLPVLVMTGWATLDIAIEALRFGVRDLVQKPWENDRVLASVREHAVARRASLKRKAHRAREMAEARQIQLALLPQSLPHVDGWSLAAESTPAEHVGGDTFDVIDLGGGRVALSLGDVSGKGTPAALLAANLQAAVRSAAARQLSPSRLCEEVNRALCASIAPGHFITYFYAVIDTASGDTHYCNAGHLPPLVAGRSGEVRRLAAGGMVLGIDAAASYVEGVDCLAPGECLLAYTDGLTEARSAEGEEFGEERLAACLVPQLADGVPPRGPDAGATIVRRVFASVLAFSPMPASDDRTAVAVSRAS
jgi:phosphoserine phosphatase RsbU/P